MRITTTTTPLEMLHGKGNLYSKRGDFLCETEYTLNGNITIEITQTNQSTTETKREMKRHGTLSPTDWDILRQESIVILELDDGRRLELSLASYQSGYVEANPTPF